MTRDRLPPGPAFPEPAGSSAQDSSEGRRPGLWASLKRALGSPGAPEETVPFLHEESDPFEPAPEPAGPAAQPNRPEPPPLSLGRIPASILEPPATAGEPVGASEAAATSSVPALSEPSPPGVEREREPAQPVPAASDPGDPTKPTRLARGLASFSRSNQEREKKFAHILRDKPPSKQKPRPGGRG